MPAVTRHRVHRIEQNYVWSNEPLPNLADTEIDVGHRLADHLRIWRDLRCDVHNRDAFTRLCLCHSPKPLCRRIAGDTDQNVRASSLAASAEKRWGLSIVFALTLAHILTGLAGSVAGSIVIVGILYRKQLAWCNAVFLSTTAAACATGFVFLPTGGVTNAQLVAFFIIFLLIVAAYARYLRRLDGSWNQVYAFTSVGVVFLNILITIAQSFLHFRALKTLAPTQDSPVYVAVKFGLLMVFVVLAIVTAQRAGRS